MADLRHRRVGSVLVCLQFALLAFLVGPAAAALVRGPVPFGAGALAFAGAAIGLWAVGFNRPGNFNIRPTPREGGRLVERGPYRWVRHPMYSALLLVGGACGWVTPGAMPWLALAALVVVLATKAAFEERWMLVVHPHYSAYRQRTRRFVPWLV